jgi:type IV secretory pathway VirB6-like protein
MAIVLSLYQTSALYQILFWRTGVIPYSLPLLWFIGIAAFFLRYVEKPYEKSRATWFGILFTILVFFAGGLSETTSGMLVGIVFVAVALGILVLAKVVLWVLLGTAPIFISCFFFDSTRSYAMGWLNQSLLYAIIPLFVYVIAAFLIAAMEPELTKIDQISGDRELTLSDFAAFIMLCLAGSFVLIQVQSIAQGIAGGLATCSAR